MNDLDLIQEMVHQLYWERDMNCACTTLCCLSSIFDVPIDEQVYSASAGLHGAGGYRAQCGLVEGGLMFIGLYAAHKGMAGDEAAALCYSFAEGFEKRFGSLRCYDLRPGGFSDNDPPHACEALTISAVRFISDFIKSASLA